MRRSESIHTALLLLAANVLYDASPQDAAPASRNGSQKENPDQGEQSNGDDDDAASFRTAPDDPEEVSAQEHPELLCKVHLSLLLIG